MSPSKEQRVFVYNQTKETLLATQVKVADSIWQRMRGLLGRRSLQPGDGVWLIPASCIHTIGMLFSFDVVLIDKNFRVVGLRELVRPFSITRPNFHARSLIELSAYTIYRSRTEIGDQLIIDTYEVKQPTDHEGRVDAHYTLRVR
jgi:uncharacterized membrane protein (UPF0127 family)